VADGVEGPDLEVPVVHDTGGGFRTAYAAADGTIVVVRPDGYLGHRGSASDVGGLTAALSGVFSGVAQS
jgi:hypothetical protein